MEQPSNRQMLEDATKSVFPRRFDGLGVMTTSLHDKYMKIMLECEAYPKVHILIHYPLVSRC